MNKEQFRQKINDSDMTLLTNFDDFWKVIKDRAETCNDIELIPGKIRKDKTNIIKTPGYIKFL
jgi:hypothetical protein